MDEFLDFLLNGEFGIVLLLCGLVWYIGWLFTGDDAELVLYRHRAWYGTFLVFGAFAFLQYGASDGNVIIVLLLRTLMAASLGAGVVGIFSPLLRWYRQGVEHREAARNRKQAERERRKREALEAKEREAEQRRSQQLMVVRDKEQRVQEVERSKQQHQDQLDAQRRMRARAACDLFFNLHKTELAPRFSKGDLDEFMKKYMTDQNPPDVVEMYALELKKTMEQHLQLSEAKRKPKDIEQLAKWYIEEKEHIANLEIDDELKESHLIQLDMRYTELSQEILEAITP